MTIAQKKAYLARMAATRHERATGLPGKSRTSATPFIERIGFKQFTVANGERGLLMRSQKIERVLAPGRYHFWDPFNRKRLRLMDVTRLERDGRDVDSLIRNLAPQLENRYNRADQPGRQHFVGFVSALKSRRVPGVRGLLDWHRAAKPEA